jgi:glutamine cyclotransferase
VNSYPHDNTAFTQGLVYRSGYLYEGTGLYGKSSLRKVDLETGKVLQERKLESRYFGEGITILNDKIYQLSWLEKKGFIYYLSNFDSLGAFSYNYEGWGITHNGSNLIISDGSAIVRFVDPLTLDLKSTIKVTSADKPLENLNELEFVDRKIYANIWLTDWIAIINPHDGEVVGKIDLTGLLPAADRTADTDVLNGIAYDQDQKRLFVTGKNWPKLFEIELVVK